MNCIICFNKDCSCKFNDNEKLFPNTSRILREGGELQQLSQVGSSPASATIPIQLTPWQIRQIKKLFRGTLK